MRSQLPACDWRVKTPMADRFYCRHSAIVSQSGIVHDAACRVCPVRLQPNPSPRPERTDDQIRVALDSLTAMPAFSEQLWNLSRALKEFVADGMKTVTREALSERLRICDECEFRTGDRCTRCGCHLTLKAQGRIFQCPENRWPAISESQV